MTLTNSDPAPPAPPIAAVSPSLTPLANPARDAAVHTQGLTKIYKDFWGRPKVEALLDLDLTIHRGEV